jgi:hypothetical protein
MFLARSLTCLNFKVKENAAEKSSRFNFLSVYLEMSRSHSRSVFFFGGVGNRNIIFLLVLQSRKELLLNPRAKILFNQKFHLFDSQNTNFHHYHHRPQLLLLSF